MSRGLPQIEARLAEWRRRPALAHLGAILVLTLFAALRWWNLLSFRGPLNDELVYLGAFEMVAAGLSPYLQSGYLYPPLTAIVGGRLLPVLGPDGVVWLFRAANLAGLATTVWCALAWAPWRWRWRLFAGCIVLALSPMVHFGVLFWNTSLLVAGLMVIGLLVWRRSPLSAGALLGASVALKPLAPVAVAVLAVHRPAGGGRRHWLAAGVALLVASMLLLPLPHFREMLTLDVTERIHRTASLHRLPSLVGLDPSPVWISALIGLAAVWLARRRAMGPALLLAFALTATLAATPLVWSHALIATLPVQAMALWLAWRRRGALSWRAAPSRPCPTAQGPPPAEAVAPAVRAHPGHDAPLRRYELWLILLAVLGIQFAEGVTSIDDQGSLVQFVGLLPTAFGPIALAAYLWAATPSSRSGRPRSAAQNS